MIALSVILFVITVLLGGLFALIASNGDERDGCLLFILFIAMAGTSILAFGTMRDGIEELEQKQSISEVVQSGDSVAMPEELGSKTELDLRVEHDWDIVGRFYSTSGQECFLAQSKTCPQVKMVFVRKNGHWKHWSHDVLFSDPLPVNQMQVEEVEEVSHE